MVIGFPHDTPELLAENVAVPAAARSQPASPISRSPSTWRCPAPSCSTASTTPGKIQLDRDYFCHMLHEMAAVPSVTYTSGPVALAARAVEGAPDVALLPRPRRWLPTRQSIRSVARALRGLATREHHSKLETGLRSAAQILLNLARVRLPPALAVARGRRARDVRRWDRVYREIRAQKLAQGARLAAPTDSHELHRRNAIVGLRREHAGDFVPPTDADVTPAQQEIDRRPERPVPRRASTASCWSTRPTPTRACSASTPRAAGVCPNYPPYGLAVLAAAAAHASASQVRIVNLNHEVLKAATRPSRPRLRPRPHLAGAARRGDRRRSQPDLIGVTCMFTMTHESLRQVCAWASRSGIPVAIGGVHVTNDVERVLDDVPAARFAFLREGDHALQEFVRVVRGAAGLRRSGR